MSYLFRTQAFLVSEKTAMKARTLQVERRCPVQADRTDNPAAAKKREPARKKAERHGVCVKTLDRWVEAGILEPPERIRGRKYWRVDAEPKTAA
jgi:hypothetical protein